MCEYKERNDNIRGIQFLKLNRFSLFVTKVDNIMSVDPITTHSQCRTTLEVEKLRNLNVILHS